MAKPDDYPLPEGMYFPLITRIDEPDMLFRVITTDNDQELMLPVCSRFGIIARLKRIDDENYYGLRIRIQDMNKQPRDADFNRSDLVDGGGRLVKSRLMDMGLRVFNGEEKQVIDALKAANPAKEILVVSRRGWHWLSDTFFVCPNGQVFGDGKTSGIELMDGAAIEANGNLKTWKQAIAKAVNNDGVPHWKIAAAAGFAGLITQLCGMDTCGIHFSGLTSRGKTLALKLATSAWTSPVFGRGLMSTWRSTDNAFEASAAESTGTIMALDELKLADGRIVASVLFQLTSGTSKSRSNLSQTLQKKIQWTTFLVSSGEQSLKEKVRAERGEWLAGTAVRFSDVDVTEVNGKVDKGVIDNFARGIQDNFGLAGPEFCKKLVENEVHNDPSKVRDDIHRAAAELVELSSEGAGKPDRDGILLRAALPFAIILVAGKLAQSYGILSDYDLTEAIEWAWKRYVASSDAAALDPVRTAERK
jgi:hypothetical protein